MDFLDNNTSFSPNFNEIYPVNGKSAYDIAVEHGFIGTEEEWLESLEGEAGYTPVKGKDYYTTEEKDELVNEIGEEVLQGVSIVELASDVEGIQKQIQEEAHFRGYVSTDAKIQAMAGTPNDFAYSAESGTKWIYDAENGWQDTNTPVPDQLTPASETVPLINGEASVGTEGAYARGDHRHPIDTTRASAEELNKVKTELVDSMHYKGKSEDWNGSFEHGDVVMMPSGEVDGSYDLNIYDADRDIFEIIYSEQTIDHKFNEIRNEKTWKTLIDTTLTEEQAGVSSVKIKIPNGEILNTITRMRVLVSIKASDADVASQTLRVKISDKDASAYSIILGWHSISCTAGQTSKFGGIYELFPVANNGTTKDVIGFVSAPTTSTGANSIGNASRVFNKFSADRIQNYLPYLYVDLASGGIMATGTRVVLEVCE